MGFFAEILGLLVLVFLAHPSAVVRAETLELIKPGALELGLGVGSTQIGGDFGSGSSTTTGYVINILTPVLRPSGATPRALFGFLQLGGDGFRADYKGSGSSFLRDQSAYISTNRIGFFLCHGVENAFQPCLGVGYLTMSISQDSGKYRQNYGSFQYGGVLRYNLNDRWGLGFSSIASDQESAFNNVESYTTYWTNLFSVAYRWEPKRDD